MIALPEPVRAWLEHQWSGALPEGCIGSQVLPSDQRLVLGLVLFARQSYRGAAQITGLPYTYVSAQCAAGLTALGRALP